MISVSLIKASIRLFVCVCVLFIPVYRQSVENERFAVRYRNRIRRNRQRVTVIWASHVDWRSPASLHGLAHPSGRPRRLVILFGEERFVFLKSVYGVVFASRVPGLPVTSSDGVSISKLV